MHNAYCMFWKMIVFVMQIFLYDEFVKQLLVWKIIIVLENKLFWLNNMV